MKPSALNGVQREVLATLAAVHCATLSQLAHLSRKQQTHVSTAAQALAELGLIEIETLSKPRIYRIAYAGCATLGIPAPSGRRLPTFAVMAHHCHRNEVAIAMAKAVPGFRFLSRLELLKKGFNPGTGEHGADDDSGTAWFVLIDDYLMGSERIARAWRRRHTPNPKYWPDKTGRVWGEVVKRFLVVTTDEGQADRHRARILRERLPAEVMLIKPLWSLI